jgi:hypothetical protein
MDENEHNYFSLRKKYQTVDNTNLVGLIYRMTEDFTKM